MGLSKLSEKCQKCNHKDTCDNKRMEACAYITPTVPPLAKGGLVSNNIAFGNFHPSGVDEIIIKVDFKPSENVIEALQKAIKRDGRCAFRGVI